MLRTIRALALAGGAWLLAAPLTAAVFVVHLTNGTSFSSRYRPVDAEWDASKVVFNDEWGNRIALSKSDIDRIDTDVELSGFGHVIDNSTVAVGWAPNDAPEEGSAEAPARLAAQAAGAEGDAGPGAEPIYNSEDLPPTMQILPSESPEGNTYVIPAPAPTPESPVI